MGQNVRPAHEFPAATLFDHRNLVVVAAQEGKALAGGSATQDRTCNHPAGFRVPNFCLHQFPGRGAKPGRNQPRLDDRGTAQGDDPPVADNPGAEYAPRKYDSQIKRVRVTAG